MASYTIAVNSEAWVGEADELFKRLESIDTLIDQIAEETVLPILARHYRATGLKVKTGRLLAAISQKGASGNIFQKTQRGVRLGVDYAVIPYAQSIIEGAQPHDIPNAFGRGHNFGIGGRFAGKFHPGNAPHAIYFLSASDLAEVEKALTDKLKA